MAETVGEFLIKLGLDANNIDRQLNSVIDNVRGGLSNLMTGVVAPALAGLASGQMVQQFADEITQVDRLSESLGVSVENLSAWRTAAEMAGVEADEVGEIFADFNDWMTDVKYDESGTLYDYIQNGLLPSVLDANGEMKKTEDYILEIADAFHNMDTAEASGIARKLGLSDLKTATWLQQGGDAIREDLELAKSIGTYTKEDAAAAREFTMSMTLLTQSLKMAALPIFRLLAPIIEGLADKISFFAEKIKGFFSNFKNMGEIGASISRVMNKAFVFLLDHITALIPLLAGIASMKLAGVFLGIAGAIQRVVTVSRAFIFSPWGAVLTALLAIGAVVEEFIKWLNGGESALSGFFEAMFGDAENAQNVLNDVYNSFMDIISGFGEAIEELSPQFEELWNALTDLFSAITGGEGFELFSDILITVTGIIISLIAGLVRFLAENGSIITDIISGIIDVITSIVEVITFVVDIINTAITSVIVIFTALGNTIEQIGSVIQSIFNAMGNAFNSFVSSVSSGASTIIGWINNILNKLSELASNSLLGRIIGSVGGSISAGLDRIANYTTDNSSSVTTTNSNNTNNYNYYGGGGGWYDYDTVGAMR